MVTYARRMHFIVVKAVNENSFLIDYKEKTVFLKLFDEHLGLITEL